MQNPEIAPENPHHGHAPVGAAAAHAALARMQGANAEAVMARYSAPEDVFELPGHCSACGAACATRMYQISIPFFKVRLHCPKHCSACGAACASHMHMLCTHICICTFKRFMHDVVLVMLPPQLACIKPVLLSGRVSGWSLVLCILLALSISNLIVNL